jgi:hypothetical protein
MTTLVRKEIPMSMRAVLRTPLLASLLLAAALALPAAHAQAQPLERLAPRDSVVALGLTPGSLPEGTLGEAFAELDVDAAREAWTALQEVAGELDLEDLSDLVDLPLPLAMMMGEMSGGMQAPAGMLGELSEMCPELEGDVEALLAERWADDLLLAVAMDAFAPLPGVLAVARTTEGSTAAAATLQDRLIACFGGETVGSQDGVDLVLLGDGSDLPLVVARSGNLFMAGTRPDIVRGAVRRAAGADEPSLADDPSFLGGEGVGARLTVRPDLLADIAEARVPTPPQEGASDALQRATAALRTFGSFSARVELTPDGVRTRSALAVRRDGGDAELADLLTCAACRASGPFLASGDAVTVTGSTFRLRAWVDWLDGLTEDLSVAMGQPMSLREALSAQLGIDLDEALLSWIGDEMHTVRFSGLSPDLRDLLQQPPSLVAVPVASPEAGRAGVEAFAQAVLQAADRMAEMDDDMLDADALRGLIAVDEREADGVPYHRVRIGPTTSYGVGVVGNRLVIAGPAGTFDRVVALRQEGGDAFASEGWQAVQELAGDSRLAWGYGDGAADLRGLAELLDLAAQPVAFGVRAALEGAAARDEAPGGGGFGMGPTTVDLATADRYGAPNLSGDPADDGMFGGGATTVDLANAQRMSASGLSGLEPPDLDVPASLGGEFGDGEPSVDGDAMDLYRLPLLPAGTEVSLAMTSEAIDTYLYLIDPEAGAIVGRNDDAPSTSRSEIIYVSDGETRPWVGAGSWSSFDAGPYQLTTEVLSQPDAAPEGDDGGRLEPADVDAPSVTEGELASGDPSIDGSPMDLYRLPSLPAGTEVTVSLTSDAFDTYLYLIDPDAEAYLAENDDAPDTSRSQITYVSDGATRPWVGASTWGSFGSGPYRLEIEVEGAEPDPEAEADEEVELPTFGELLPAFDLVPETVELIASRIGDFVRVTGVEDDVLRSESRLAIDW